jgi:branched-chain amino acid transport system substrate-binding protein
MKELIAAAFLVAVLSSNGTGAPMNDRVHFEPHGQDRVKIGVMFIASGVMGGYGRHGRQAVELATDEINNAGGINGKRVEFLFEDTELNAGKVTEIAERFIHEEKVDFLIGPTSSGLAVTLSRIAKENHIPLVLAQAASESLTGTDFHKYVFGTLSNSMMHARAGAYVAADLPLENWMVIGPDYNYGHSSWEMFIDKLRELKPTVTIAGELFPPLMNPDFTSYIETIIATAPDAVWAPIWGNDAVNFIEQAIILDPDIFNRIKFFIPDGASLEVLDPVGPDMPDGIFMSSRYYFASPNTQENSAFIQAYLSRFNEMPDYMACETYAAVYFIKAAVERAKSKQADRVIAAVEREPLAWNTPEGWKIMRREDHQVVEDVLWGETFYTEGSERSDLRNIMSIQGEIICRTPDELVGINPAADPTVVHHPCPVPPGRISFVNHTRRPASTRALPRGMR